MGKGHKGFPLSSALIPLPSPTKFLVMNKLSLRNTALLVLFLAFCFSCKDLSQLNINPNGVQPETVNPNLVMPTVLSETAKLYLNLGFQDIAGVVQHTQKDA